VSVFVNNGECDLFGCEKILANRGDKLDHPGRQTPIGLDRRTIDDDAQFKEPTAGLSTDPG
jgi:hypothetical protein